MKKLIAILSACFVAIAAAGAADQGASKDEVKKEAKKGVAKQRDMKKEEMMKDMYTGGMGKDQDGRKDNRKK